MFRINFPYLKFAWIAVLLCTAFGFFFSFYRPDQELMVTDSPRYVGFGPLASAGYPLFIKLCRLLLPDLDSIVYLQVWIYAASIAYLCAIVAQLTRSAWAGGAAAAAILINPKVNEYLFSIVTEALSFSLTALTLAAFGAIVLRRTTYSWLWASTAIGLASTVRPPNVAFVAPLLIALFVYRKDRSQRWAVRMAAAVLPLVLLLAGEELAWRAYHDGPRRTLTGIHMLAKGGMVDGGMPPATAATAPPALQPLRRALAEDLAPVRVFLALSPNLPTWCRVSGAYETFMEYGFAQPKRAMAEALLPDNPDRVLITLGLERIRQSPGDYAALTARHLACMWTLTVATRAQTGAYWHFIDNHRPLLYEAEFGPYLIDRSKGPAHPPLAPVVITVFVASGIITAIIASLSLPAFIRAQALPPTLMMASFAAVMTHANLLLTALIGIGLGRYALGMWAPIAVSAGLGAWFVGGRLVAARHRPYAWL